MGLGLGSGPTVPVSGHSPLGSRSGRVGLLKGQRVWLSTPSSAAPDSSQGWGPAVPLGAVLPTGPCFGVAMGTCCSSTLSSPTAEGSSGSPGKGFSCGILLSPQHLFQKSFGLPEMLSPEVIHAKESWGLWASPSGVFLPFPVVVTSASDVLRPEWQPQPELTYRTNLGHFVTNTISFIELKIDDPYDSAAV